MEFKIGDLVRHKISGRIEKIKEINDSLIKLENSDYYIFYELLEKIEIKKPSEEDLKEMFKNIEIKKNGEDNTRPKHYLGKSGKQVFDILEDYLSDEELKGFYIGNVIKYVLRHKNKNGVEDLEKAREYLDKLIEKEKMKND